MSVPTAFDFDDLARTCKKVPGGARTTSNKIVGGTMMTKRLSVGLIVVFTLFVTSQARATWTLATLHRGQSFIFVSMAHTLGKMGTYFFNTQLQI
jgi:hydrogenase maturation factor